MTPCVEHSQAGRYARVRRDGRQVCQHVAVWEAAHGPKPDGWQVDHLCRNNRCVNIDHLEAVPALMNRRRAARLTDEIVAALRAEYAAIPRGAVRARAGERVRLAERYGISVRHLCDVVAGRRWA